MMRKFTSYIICILFLGTSLSAQVSTKKIENVIISSTQAKLLGNVGPIRTAVIKPVTSKIKKNQSKIEKKVPDNFKWRRNKSKAVHLDKEHQGPDRVLQSEVNKQLGKNIEVIANVQGLGLGSPTDPTGDVNKQYYVQGVNVTDVGVYNLDGSLEMSFPMNTLWNILGASSAGDPIILFDEVLNKWFITEFADPSNVLIAVSDSNDPLGTYNAYNFATPNFPDYPKYAITPDALVFTSNEEGPGALHQYFIDKAALAAGAAEVAIQRIEIEGTQGSEQAFIVSTPVDWNGTTMPYDNKPMVLRLNDSSWANGPTEDRIEIYTFDIDFADPDNSTVEQTSVVISPFDSHPCSAFGDGFQCIPQLNGEGLDGIPELIMNIPMQRNFGTHESMVFTFVTDASDGNNIAAVRWVELRRSAGADWALYQEGTFGPDDGLERFMSSIAIDEEGNICLGYSVSSDSTFAGLRATGRNVEDPLGEMTFDELIIREGQSTIESGGRFGDYAQMSVAPGGLSEFWFTSEYAGPDNTLTNITGMRLRKDSFDLSMRAILEPAGISDLFGGAETVTVVVNNVGINPIDDYTIDLFLDGSLIEEIDISETIASGASVEHTFNNTIDLSEIRDYTLTSSVSASQDTNPLNNTESDVIQKIPSIEAALSGSLPFKACSESIDGQLEMVNLGGQTITSAIIEITVNGTAQENITYTGNLATDESAVISFTVSQGLTQGINEIVATIIEINNQSDDFNIANNSKMFTNNLFPFDDFITVVFVTDLFANESSYTLFSESGEAIAESNPFREQNTAFEDMICVPHDSCYTLVVLDSYGDGICCENGEGSITILNNQGNTVAFSNGEFGSELVIDFCPNEIDCNLTADIEVTQSSSPTADDGIILVNAMNGVEPYQYSISGVNNLQSSNVFEGLSPDVYTVFVTDATGNCTYEEDVVIDFQTAVHQVAGDAVSVEILPNPTDGIFKIKINDLPIQEKFLTIRIYDIQGKMLQHRAIGKYDDTFVGTFSLYAYPAGTYLVNIITPNGNILEKLVKK